MSSAQTRPKAFLYSNKTQGMNHEQCHVETMPFSKAVTTARAKNTLEILQDVKPQNRNRSKERPFSEKQHHPFITKVQVRIRSTKCEFDPRTNVGSTCDGYDNRSCPKSVNVAVKYNSTDTIGTGENSNNEWESSANSHSSQESKSEQRLLRRKMLGELALAPYVKRESKDNDELLFQPRFTAKDCRMQLLLVKELTNHLNCASRNTRSTEKRSTVFHARATKGEIKFGIRR